jgi:hypothetical protein
LNLTHSPISQIIPVTDSSILTIGFDRNIYQYDCDSSDNWTLKRSLTKDVSNPLLQAPGITGGVENISASIQEFIYAKGL